MQPAAATADPGRQSRLPALAVEGLSKSFRAGFWLNRVVSPLRGCTLEVFVGETFGLLGPNGAGKTTLLKVLLGIVRPSAGKATLLGHPLGDAAVRARLGYLPENPYFYEYLTGEETLRFVGKLFGLSEDVLARRIPGLLERVGLSREAARCPLRKYSKGMLQRIGLAQALINDPQLVFLDEPMSGLDPTGRRLIRETILQLRAEGKTVFFNSHILADVEVLCDRIGLLVQGQLVSCGTLEALLGSEQTYRAAVAGVSAAQLAHLLSDSEQVGERVRGRLKVPVAQFTAQLPSQAVLIDLKLERRSLEEFFQAKVAEHQGRIFDT
jgi:ABC-2 type transport system ATP-binding protein